VGVGHTTECTVHMQLTFPSASPLNLTPNTTTVGVAGLGDCPGLGLGTNQITWTGSITVDAATCADIAGDGSGNVTYPTGSSPSVTMAIAGTGVLESWAAVSGSLGTLEGAGAFAWTDTGEITACLTTNTLLVDMDGQVVIVT